MIKDAGLRTIAVFAVAAFILFGCTKPPTLELIEAERAVGDAKSVAASQCAPKLFSEAEEALEKGRDLLVEFGRELRARRQLIDAKVLAEEAKTKCVSMGNKSIPEPYDF